MASTTTNALKVIAVPATKKHTATVFFLHGLGDSGHGWYPVAKEIQPLLPHVKFILPHAPRIPITINGGFSMPGWYDIISLDRHDDRVDEKGMMTTVAAINQMIKDEIAAGISPKRIVLGGFSQGAAMTLLTSLTTDIKLAGFIGLSGYLPLHKKVDQIVSSTNQWTPYFMGHGDSDEVVEYEWGKLSADRLKEMGREVTFKTYRGMGHSSSEAELRDITAFLKQVLPDEE
ncbi:hypothetical protein HDU76_013957 [Blyttiomyces sp. JEL0837]|nr:hypothetical protein HDU76_013957 [Blyttiomyces sp. JEL0837]